MSSSSSDSLSATPRVLGASGPPVLQIPEIPLKLVRSVEITANFLRCKKFFLKNFVKEGRYGGNGEAATLVRDRSGAALRFLMMTTRKTIWRIAAITVLVLATLLVFDYWSRCHSKPLSREDALRRANVRLQHLSQEWVLGDTLPSLVEQQFEPKDGSWSFTFRNNTCEVSIITDRCNGTDVGGMSKGCTTHQPDKR